MAIKEPGVLLVVEDDTAMRSLICDEFWDLGLRIVEAGDGDEALERITEQTPDLIVTDLRMPAGGLDYVARLRTLAPQCPIILMTAFGDPSVRTEALQAGVTAYFSKPVRMSELKAAVIDALDHKTEATD
ncbi:MAG: response regulator [Nitrospira sp.]|nr:response regulator [Nitrospira sp.]